MTALTTTKFDTTPVRAGFSFDESGLVRWMKANVAGFSGPLKVEQFNGGQSNPTYKLTTLEKAYVLRRKPSGALLKGAHAIDREVRVLSALERANFPVPHVYGLCEDSSVIGSAFYVMDLVEGRIFWTATLPELSMAERPAYFDEMNTVLARLHRLQPEAVGLDDFGRPGNYFDRQIARWSRQYLDDVEASRDPNMDRLIEWLPANIPDDDDRHSIVHGDYRIDNVIFHPHEPKILAVLDWELSTLGHPFSDFAYNAMMYRMPSHIVAGLKGANLTALNIPTEEQYLAAYCRHMGLESMPGYDFYITFNFFRLAAIYHGIKGRMIRGTASSALAKERAAVLPELMELAWQQAARAEAKSSGARPDDGRGYAENKPL